MLFLVPLLAKRRWKASMACCAGFLAGLGPYLVWSRLRFGGFFLTLHKGWTNVEGKESVFFYLRNSGAIFTPVALFGLAIAAVFSVWRFFGPSRSQPRLLNSFAFQPSSLVAFLWLWLLADFLFFSGMTHKEPRYVLPLAPPFLLLAGSGLALFCAPQRRAIRFAGALLLFELLSFTFLPTRERFSGPFIDHGNPEEMVASQFLESEFGPKTILYMSFNYPAFAFYTNFRIHELSAVGPILYKDINHIPPGGVLILYRKTDEVWLPDLDWVSANPRFQRIRDYNAFVLFRHSAEAARWI